MWMSESVRITSLGSNGSQFQSDEVCHLSGSNNCHIRGCSLYSRCLRLDLGMPDGVILNHNPFSDLSSCSKFSAMGIVDFVRGFIVISLVVLFFAPLQNGMANVTCRVSLSTCLIFSVVQPCSV